MDFIIDEDVKDVLEFTRGNMSADKLIVVVAAVGKIVPIIWEQNEPVEIIPLMLAAKPPTSQCDLQTRSSSI